MFMPGIFFLFSGVSWILLAVGIFMRRQRARRQELERTRATGVVVAHEGRQGAACVPIIEFTVGGKVLRPPSAIVAPRALPWASLRRAG